MADFITDVFMTLDGYGTGTEGYWGKDGPELRALRERLIPSADETLVMGAETYRMMSHFAEVMPAAVAPFTAAEKIVLSRTLEAPLTWDNTTLVPEDAVDAIPRLKAESTKPLRCHGSLSLNRALLAAGLVDRLEVIVFPIINGATGSNKVFDDLPDIDLELVGSDLLDGRTQRLVYVPTVR
ncbi:MAG: dihydrofolate reductase family protein [Solirubrobacteraceae bacterium]|nr:dihydrofolate reductase family protein [Patulibacter sp.]